MGAVREGAVCVFVFKTMMVQVRGWIDGPEWSWRWDGKTETDGGEAVEERLVCTVQYSTVP